MSALTIPSGDGVQIRACTPADWKGVWRLLEPVFREGKTYVFDPDIPEEEAKALWFVDPLVTFVAVVSSGVVGTYYLKANQPGRGDHICNCGYVVAPEARGKGVASALCVHSQREAVGRGFSGMQFNFVVSTNAGAIRLWERHGFSIVGTLPGAFRDPEIGKVDAHVMFKWLDGGGGAGRGPVTP